MRKCNQILILSLLVINSLHLQAAEKLGYKHSALQDPEILKISKEYSRQVIEQNPAIGNALNRLGLKYLHELDPAKTYTFNQETQEVSIQNSQSISAASISGLFGFGTPVATISSTSDDILGLARPLSLARLVGKQQMSAVSWLPQYHATQLPVLNTATWY